MGLFDWLVDRFVKIRGATGWRVKCVKCASGRVLTEKDTGVVWAQKALKEGQK